jgi:hypothetical protein
MAYDPGADLHELLAQGRQRPMLDLLGQGQRAQEVGLSLSDSVCLREAAPAKAEPLAKRVFFWVGERLPPGLNPFRFSAHPHLRGHPATPLKDHGRRILRRHCFVFGTLTVPCRQGQALRVKVKGRVLPRIKCPGCGPHPDL